ncbi:Translation initiation factor IF-2 [Candidatus Promineifilum breve]|uniref:Translation initiation factor IF-2 n=1 Tax=Candidatus Promineifilum breve TaxID=1806508 RepID=A0A170PGW3_9CHLR|nr:translation initiation factor IF-2 [Candidatus Promineifilum breve]CUS03977.2 Translation initiation factor IF-2 [Candidatus Promineifilum breve]
MAETKTLIEIPAFITVRELAVVMGLSPINIIKELMANGIMANINQQIDFDTAAIVAGEMGFDVVAQQVAAAEAVEEEAKTGWRKVLADESKGDLAPRPPIVTMLGHVDHGKTSLLDIIRQANVTAGEAGGITQHIGAYQTVKDGRLVTFLDTPGHEAFTAMRARGAQATDIAILVVAADDGVMPQTREAVDHARAAGVPIIVALNKIDLAGARPDRVKQQLSDMELVPDDWDGDTMVIPVSAREKLGIDDLLEAILLTAEEVDPRANPQAPASGTVLEAKIERGKGIMTTILVQNGTLHLGDTLLVGEHHGRIKSMFDYTGRRVSEAGPSMPVAVSGLDGIPVAGEQFNVVDNEKLARKMIEDAIEEARVTPTSRGKSTTLDEFFARLVEGEAKTLNLIVKADVQGSLEPIVTSLERLNGGEVELEILRAATGPITESDVMLASASDAIILGFNVEADPIARNSAAVEEVQIRTYQIIYKLIEDVERAMRGMLAPTFEDVVIGRAEVRQVFKIRNLGVIAGSYMRTGEARRNAKARIIRNSRLLHSGPVGSLKHLQENVREVKAGFEFGVSVDGWNEFLAGDIIEFFVTQRVEL